MSAYWTKRILIDHIKVKLRELGPPGTTVILRHFVAVPVKKAHHIRLFTVMKPNAHHRIKLSRIHCHASNRMLRSFCHRSWPPARLCSLRAVYIYQKIDCSLEIEFLAKPRAARNAEYYKSNARSRFT